MDSVFLLIDILILGIILLLMPKEDLILKKITKFFKLLKRRIDGFLHCPICIVLAFVSVFIGVTRSCMFYILFREFVRAESNFKLKFSS